MLGFLSRLATNETGIIMVATALLFPTAALLYGVLLMFFAAKDTVERWSRAKDAKAKAKGLEEGRKEGIEAGRAEIVCLAEGAQRAVAAGGTRQAERSGRFGITR